MQEGEAWDALEKRDDSGACIEAFVVRPPGLQGAAGDLKDFRRVTLGETLSLQGARPLKQTRAFDAIPALVAIIVASWRILDDCAHSDLLCPPFALVYVMAKDGGVASWFQPFVRSRHGLSGAIIGTKWPTP